MLISNIFYKKHNKVKGVSDSGSKMQDILEMTDDGRIIKTGEHNVYEEIQSYKDGVSIPALLEKFNSGMENAFNIPINEPRGYFIKPNEFGEFDEDAYARLYQYQFEHAMSVPHVQILNKSEVKNEKE